MFRISLPGKMTFPFTLVFLFCFAVMNRFIVAVLASTTFEDVTVEHVTVEHVTGGDDSTRVIHKWVSSTPEKPVPAKSSSALMSRYSNFSLLIVWFAEATDPIGPVLPSLFLPTLFLPAVFLPAVFLLTVFLPAVFLRAVFPTCLVPA